jgi:hypothetical protein
MQIASLCGPLGLSGLPLGSFSNEHLLGFVMEAFDQFIKSWTGMVSSKLSRPSSSPQPMSASRPKSSLNSLASCSALAKSLVSSSASQRSPTEPRWLRTNS